MRTLLACALTLALLAPACAADRKPIYPVDGKGMQRIETALADAGRLGKRVLLMTGGNWCGWCYKLHECFTANEEIADLLRREYLLVMIDTEADKGVLEKWKIAPEGVPYLTVLDSAGKKVVDQETGAMEVGKEHDLAKVYAFLEAWITPGASAGDVLKNALATANTEGKLVFLVFGAEWCGWCHRLEDFLAEPAIKAIFDKAFVTARIDVDKNAGAKDLHTEALGVAECGVPSFAFLDAQRKVLAKSNGAGENIGYPASAEVEIPYFKEMLLQAKSKLDAKDIDTIIARLGAFSRKFEQPR
jgi:thioredoxin-related protein